MICSNCGHEEQFVHPNWYEVLTTVKSTRKIQPYERIDDWREQKGVSVELAEELAYGIASYRKSIKDVTLTFYQWAMKELRLSAHRNGKEKVRYD